MIDYDAILQLEAAEQERLRALPHAVPEKHRLKEYYGGVVVLEECSQDSPRTKQTYSRDQKAYTCMYAYCSMAWTEDELVKGKGWDKDVPFITPPHARVLPEDAQAERRIDLVCDLLGIGSNSDAGMRASLAARDARQAETIAGRYAAALPTLLTALITQEVNKNTPAAVNDLLTFQLEADDTPFFTEATLYELLGKGEARSLLALTRRLAKATGYKERTG